MKRARHSAQMMIQKLEQRQLLSFGDFDPTFGTKGQVLFGGNEQEAAAAVRQPDGKILVAGTVYDRLTRAADFAISRYNTNGSLDSSFGIKGTVRTDFDSQSNRALAIALAPGNKIVVVGNVDYGSRYNIARYDSSGKLDSTFDGDGKKTFTASDTFSLFKDGVGVDASGKIILSGYRYDSTPAGQPDYSLNVFRFTPSGTFDNSFDGDGKMELHTGVTERPIAAGLRSDGKITAVFNNGDYKAQRVRFRRINTNGTLDTAFGIKQIDEASNLTVAVHQVLFANGKIYIGGLQEDSNSFSGTRGIIYRLNSDATLDTTFDGDGRLLLAPDYYARINAIAARNDGKVIVQRNRETLAVFNANGSPDLTFSQDGEALFNDVFPNIDQYEPTLITQDNNKLLIVGTDGVPKHFTISQVTTGGKLDASFGYKGVVAPDSVGVNGQLNDVAELADGSSLVTGYTVTRDGENNFYLAKFTAAGKLDVSFGSKGITVLDLGNVNAGLKLQTLSNGKILVSANIDSTGAVLRFSSSGKLDTSFGTKGLLKYGSVFAVAKDGKLIVADATNVRRFSADGKIDASFGNGGVTSLAHSGNHYIERIADIQFFNDGKILIAAGGHEGALDEQHYLSGNLVRLSTSGKVDTGYGDKGWGVFSFGSYAQYPGVKNAVIQKDGSVIVLSQDDDHGTLYRFTSKGQIDASFGDYLDEPYKYIYTARTSGGTAIYQLKQDSKGRLIVLTLGDAGEIGESRIILVRYNADGSIDRNFGGNGQLAVDLSPATYQEVQRAKSFALGKNGKLLLASTVSEGSFPAEFRIAKVDGADLQSGIHYFKADEKLVIVGSAKADRISVAFSDDQITATLNSQVQYFDDRGTRSFVFAGEGDDNITVNAGGVYRSGIFLGESGNDRISLSGSGMQAHGGAGNDSITGGAGRQSLYGDAGNDTLRGGDDNDTIEGGSGNDLIVGDSGDDQLVGNSGNDYFDGGDGNDAINAGSGNDTLIGGAGKDALFGQDGNDTFYTYDGEADSLDGGAGTDSASTDVLDMRNGVEVTL